MALIHRFNKGRQMIDALEQARRQHGLPIVFRVDQGSQFTSKELDLWAYASGVTLDFSRPGKPTDNAYAESFNATVRLEMDQSRKTARSGGRVGGEPRHHRRRGDSNAWGAG
jgi:transposase InsO family protein